MRQRAAARVVPAERLTCPPMADVVHELLATEAAIGKLGARTISADEAGQLARNEHVTVRNPHGEETETRRL